MGGSHQNSHGLGLNILWKLALASLAASPGLPAQTIPSENQSALTPRALFDHYCVACHNQKLKTANLQLDTLDLLRIAQNSQVLEKVVRKLRAGMMPPAGMRRPDPASR